MKEEGGQNKGMLRMIKKIQFPPEYQTHAILAINNFPITMQTQRDMNLQGIRYMNSFYKRVTEIAFSFNSNRVTKDDSQSFMGVNIKQGEAIIPFFQPIISCLEGKLIGVEVFARLRDRKRKTAYFPSKIINHNTTQATFNKITEQLLKRILTIISLGNFKVVDGCFINLNLSPKQLGNQATFNMLSYYSQKLCFYGFKLNIEITETHEIIDYDAANDFILELSQLGIDTYLDDYGKGFSSPLLLKHLSIAGLKIDKGFVYNVDQCDFSKDFILQTVNQAKSKGLKVIVEGIETATQHRIISELGADFTQGFLHGKPAPLHFIDDYYSRFIYCE